MAPATGFKRGGRRLLPAHLLSQAVIGTRFAAFGIAAGNVIVKTPS
jgi:hypothetical protein